MVFVYLAVTGLLMFVLMKWLVRLRHGRAEIILKTDVAAEAPGREPVWSMFVCEPHQNLPANPTFRDNLLNILLYGVQQATGKPARAY